MNLRPPGYEPDELPTALLRDIFCSSVRYYIIHTFPEIASPFAQKVRFYRKNLPPTRGGRFLLLFALFLLGAAALGSLLLFEDNELAEEVVENNHDDCEDYLCGHFAAEVKIYQRDAEHLAVEVQEIYEYNKSELLNSEGEEPRRDE